MTTPCVCGKPSSSSQEGTRRNTCASKPTWQPPDDGQVRSGQVRSGQVRSGQVRSGQVRMEEGLDKANGSQSSSMADSKVRPLIWKKRLQTAMASMMKFGGRGWGVLLRMHTVLHHLRWEDLCQQDVQGRRLVVPVVRIVVAAPRLQLVIKLQAILQV
jgi:hypothetical protein